VKPELLLEINCIHHYFQPEVAFRLAVEQLTHKFQGILGLYGLSGSGKTTLIKILAGIIHPQIGDFRFYFKGSPTDVPRIIYAPQFPERIFLGVRVQDTIERIVANRADGIVIKDRLIDFLNKFGVNYHEIESRCGFELSGGETRRLALCLSMSLVPDLLILDEPTIAMGPTGKAQLVAILNECLLDSWVIVVSHDFNLIRKICRKCWILHHGSLIFRGNLSELKTRTEVKEMVGIHLFDNYCIEG
jgi:ABC-type multidrug transport system ATPase subunit